MTMNYDNIEKILKDNKAEKAKKNNVIRISSYTWKWIS